MQLSHWVKNSLAAYEALIFGQALLI